MSKRTLVIDPTIAGISGDMIVSAIVDLGADEKGTVDAMESIGRHLEGCKQVKAQFRDVTKNNFRAKYLSLNLEEEGRDRDYVSLEGALKDTQRELGVSKAAEGFALRSLELLFSAEASLHHQDVKTIHLHEAGSVDTLVDFLGASFALDDLKLFNDTDIYSTPVAVGGGSLTFSHGTLSNPSPAVLEIARRCGIVIVGGPVNAETATPTGLAMLGSLDSRALESYPRFRPHAVGIGAGTREFEGVPNILRMTIGESLNLIVEEIVVLETNLDDLTGEEIGYATERILEEGAKDVSVIPAMGKKGRPGFIMKVITESPRSEELANIIMKETGTLGVRVTSTPRYVASRDFATLHFTIDSAEEIVKLKISRDGSGNLIAMKPEYEDVRYLARKYKRPLRTVKEEIIEQARKKLAT